MASTYIDYYQSLGLAKTATSEQIQKAYRRLAMKYHPDRNQNNKAAEEKFKEIKEAYEVLKDPEKRKAYDELGSNWRQGQDFRPPPGWEQAGAGGGGFRQHGAGDFAEGDFEGFSDFFSQLFGRSKGSRGQHFRGHGFQERGQDQRARIQIDLKEAYQGVSRMLQLDVPEIDVNGQVAYKKRTLKITIPAGTLSGQQLRLAKQGAPSMSGGEAGDLYLEIDVLPDRLFSLQDKDVYLTLPLTPWEAALGADIKVPTLGDPVTLKLGAGAQPGQKLRLKGKGMPSKSGAGDQYVIVQINTPKAITDEDKAWYKKMSELMPFNPRQAWE